MSTNGEDGPDEQALAAGAGADATSSASGTGQVRQQDFDDISTVQSANSFPFC